MKKYSSSFRRACCSSGNGPKLSPGLTADAPEAEAVPDTFFTLVEPMGNDDWDWLREAIPNRYGRLPEHRDRDCLEALRTVVRNSNADLNWSLLRTPYGSSNAVRQKWLHYNARQQVLEAASARA
jgi:hypothetical protein